MTKMIHGLHHHLYEHTTYNYSNRFWFKRQLIKLWQSKSELTTRYHVSDRSQSANYEPLGKHMLFIGFIITFTRTSISAMITHLWPTIQTHSNAPHSFHATRISSTRAIYISCVSHYFWRLNRVNRGRLCMPWDAWKSERDIHTFSVCIRLACVRSSERRTSLTLDSSCCCRLMIRARYCVISCCLRRITNADTYNKNSVQ